MSDDSFSWQPAGVASIPGKLISLVLLCLLCAPGAFAQSVWRLDVASDPAVAYLDTVALESLAVGDNFIMRVDVNEEYTIRIDRSNVSANGDRSWFGSITGTGLDYALTITVGDKTAHLIFTSPSGIFQYYGIRSGDGVYSGGFNLLEYVRDEVAITDTVLTFEEDPGQEEGSDPGSQDLVVLQIG